MDEMERMKTLVDRLNAASQAYYNSGEELMSNFDYDKLYDELLALEEKNGTILPDSPTARAGYQVMDVLPKVTHEFPTLSLDKTKDASLFPKLFGVRDEKAVVMWKLDGSTIMVTYEGGRMTCAATRGNGYIGSNISHNAPFLKGLPKTIPFLGKLVVRGEAVMSYAEFGRINENLPPEEQYKNPRNLANATISLLSSREMSQREICFHGFKLVYMDENPQYPFHASFAGDLEILKTLGFHTVEFALSPAAELEETMDAFSQRAAAYPFPVDGLVVAANDVSFAEAQPGTGHNPNKLVGFALKWQDETAATTLRDIHWQASRTGLLNPVAVFDPVELEGTTVTRATLHNISYILELDLKVGDSISVYKANKIIPKVGENFNKTRENVELQEDSQERHHIPRTCPSCGGAAEIADDTGSGSFALLCRNPNCPAKKIGRFVHFCTRNCMNIIGLSEATVEKFVDSGYIREYGDFWKLDRYESDIVSMEGFGQKSYDRLQKELEKARDADFCQLVQSLSIPGIGVGQAKLLFRHYLSTLDTGADIVDAWRKDLQDETSDFSVIEGFGGVLDEALHTWGRENLGQELDNLLKEIRIKDRIVPEKTPQAESPITGKTFVITGDVYHFKNRAALQKEIEALGGKATGSVSKNTDYLINNDAASESSKNKKAKQLGIPILTEEDFLALIGR